jgi:formiminotetrahydrofolate cyclodeaminase
VSDSIENFLDQVARKGSWVGGGSVAAFGAALSAALLQKLVHQSSTMRRLRVIRADCLRLMARDAKTFARVIAATRANRRGSFQRSLKAATEVPTRVAEQAGAIRLACRRAERLVKPKFRSDLRCARALADAADESARALIATNLAWLKDRRYANVIRRRLSAARRTHVR